MCFKFNLYRFLVSYLNIWFEFFWDIENDVGKKKNVYKGEDDKR